MSLSESIVEEAALAWFGFPKIRGQKCCEARGHSFKVADPTQTSTR